MPSSFGTLVPHVSIPSELASESSLLSYLSLSSGELKKIWWFRGHMYRQFNIAKAKGKVRVINAPDNRLKFLQRRIATLLGQLYRVRNPVHGFVQNRSVKTNAKAHLHKRFVLNVDLKSFFPSITEKRIKGVLQSLGIDFRVSSIIARLCCYNGYLPQGAPTSPVLSNMICFRLDKELLAFAKETRCIYTRYADDITFSSYQPMAAIFGGIVPPAGHFLPEILAPKLRQIFIVNGFTINPEKVHYADRHSRRIVTGIKINELLNVDRRFVRNIRAAIHSIEKLGEKAAQEKYERTFDRASNICAHLQGKISWLRHIRGQSDPVFRAIAVRFNSCFPDNKIKVLPTAEEIRDRAVWVIECLEDENMWQGSAFFLKGAGLVTAAHCVEGVDEVKVYHPSKPANKFTAKVLHRDAHRDFAILEHGIAATDYFELESSTHAVAVGDDLTAVGYPSFGPGDAINVRNGRVSSLVTKSAVRRIEVTQKLSQGMSGGALLYNDNSVVGIIHKGGASEDRDFATRVEELNAWLVEIAQISA